MWDYRGARDCCPSPRNLLVHKLLAACLRTGQLVPALLILVLFFERNLASFEFEILNEHMPHSIRIESVS